MTLSRTAAAACSARFACSSEIITSLNEMLWSPDANAFAFPSAAATASLTRSNADLRASENAAAGVPASFNGEEAEPVLVELRSSVEIEDSADSTPTAAVMSGIMLRPSGPVGRSAAPAGVAASRELGGPACQLCFLAYRPDPRQCDSLRLRRVRRNSTLRRSGQPARGRWSG